MALVHEFILVLKENNDFFDFSAIERNKIILKNSKLLDVVKMSDELVLYLMDIFNWVPSSNSLNSNMGLNYYGITYISNENGLLFGKIFTALVDLFSIAPEIFKLKGEFCWEEDNIHLGKREVITLKRENVVSVLRKMVVWSEYMKKDHNLYVVHMGI